jgi:uncharacterized protein (DUF2235 family)
MKKIVLAVLLIFASAISAFSAGTGENIRRAYEWLVENYNDGDEIFIFGFSRGAYTARSLAGLVARCLRKNLQVLSQNQSLLKS